MTGESGWELYRTLLGVLQEGSLSGAARALGITQPTVGRHISALEAAFGRALFTRSPTGLQPTEAALALRPFAESIHATVAALRREGHSHGKGVTGAVRVSASEVIGAEVLPGVVAGLLREHPGLVVELVLTNRVQDLLRREADIAVRMTQPRQKQLIARRVGSIALGLHAHRRYLQQRGTPRTVTELGQHALVGFDSETPFLRGARKAFPAWEREAFAVRSDSDVGQLALLRAGCGIGVCQVPLAKRDAALVRILPRQFDLRLDTWVTMHEDLRGSARCKTVFDALVKGVASYAGSEA
jgi:DNA-binding transcriptional LysR family regulator